MFSVTEAQLMAWLNPLLWPAGGVYCSEASVAVGAARDPFGSHGTGVDADGLSSDAAQMTER